MSENKLLKPVLIDQDTHQALKTYSSYKGKKMSEVATEVLNHYLLTEVTNGVISEILAEKVVK